MPRADRGELGEALEELGAAQLHLDRVALLRLREVRVRVRARVRVRVRVRSRGRSRVRVRKRMTSRMPQNSS